ncbi:hypothetical protein L596_003046 [Steinernema carpocapsae]|uniref:DUF5648 domain-containing protein n=1 Tax=Steinernema carpocapsae TaxID=34508 RepID=A0A4U8UR83_STECR|nr:hypothetical protein L596_003046 [Steinernema carpocapsae]
MESRVTLSLVAVFGVLASTAQSRTEVAYLVDPSIAFNINQKNALFNALLDLNARTCLRFVPRTNQVDYIVFSDMGSNTPCWNVFEKFLGQIDVNGGEFCIRPMFPPFKFKQVFSTCDIQYINEIHNCPQASYNFDKRCVPSGFLWPYTAATRAFPTTTQAPRVVTFTRFTPATLSTGIAPISMLPKPIVPLPVSRPSLQNVTNANCGSACFYSGELAPLYRAYNEKLGVTDHFYTTDRIELQTMAVDGYVIQRQMGYLAKNEVDLQCSCLTPLYRLFHTIFSNAFQNVSF